MYKCKYCNKEYLNPKSIGGHMNFCKENPNRDIPFKNISIDYRKEINEKINKNKNKIEKTKETYKTRKELGLYNNFTGKGSTEEIENTRRKNISNSMKNNPKAGGYRKGSGRGKSGWYKGYWCDSSWELVWVIYNLDHNIKFERNKQAFEYTFENKKYKYYPDFIIDDNLFIEIKGRRKYDDISLKDKEKINQFKQKIKIILNDDIKPILKYVIDKYGKNFILLYEK